MTDTTFTDQVTTIEADWLNDVNNATYTSVPANTASIATNAADIANNTAKIGGINTKMIDIGDWNMVSTTTVNIAHGLTYSKIRNAIASIRNDADSIASNFSNYNNAANSPQSISWNSININLTRSTNSDFDNTNYDATSFNRGWIIIQYSD